MVGLLQRVLLAPVLALALAVGLVLVAPPAAHATVYVDDTPDAGWRVDGTVYATLIVGDTLYVGGQFQNAVSPQGATLPRRNLAAFSMVTGDPVTAWRADTAGQVRALDADGTSLYVGGSFTRIGTTTVSRVAKVDLATSAVDTAFRPTVDATVRAVLVSGPDVYLGGSFATVNGVARSRVAMVDAQDGQLRPGFAGTANNAVYGFALDAAGRRLYVAGNFTSLGGSARTGMGVLNADSGALGSTVFASAARPTLGLDLSPDGSQLFGAGGGSTNAAAAWSTTSGVRQWRQTTNGDIQAVRYYGGEVFFGFHDGYQGDTTLKLLAADARTGVIDPDFRPRIESFWGSWSLDATDAGLVVGGDFQTVSGVPAQGFARFRRTGALPPPPDAVHSYVDSTTPWRYWDQGAAPAGWSDSEFDDTSWPSGLPQLGYGDGDEQTVIGWGPSSTSRYITSYFRAEAQVETLPDSVELTMAADDGAVVYVNGVEAARDNMPTGPITDSTRAPLGRSGGAENEMRPFAIDPSLFRVGRNVIAVEVHQNAASSSDLTFDADLTGTVRGTANRPPTASFSATADLLQATFDASGSSDPEGPLASYAWNFGDGATGAGVTAQHTYGAPGDYVVTLRVTDAAGASDTAVSTVAVRVPTTSSVLVENGSTWKWWYDGTAPASTWALPTFGDASWPVGNAVLGFGGSQATTIDSFASTSQRPLTAYFRRTFSLPSTAGLAGLTLTTVADDGVVVYVNGAEVGRSNMPSGAVGFTTYAASARSSSTAAASPVTVEVPASLLQAGTNVIAVETHLNYRGTRDVSFDLSATLHQQS